MAASPVRVALLADTHGVIDTRIAQCVEDCDYAMHAGDVGSGAVLRALRPRREVLAVRGNNDVASKWPREDWPVLAALPELQTLALPGGLLVAVHGHRAGPAGRRHARLRTQFPEARVILYGHSHRLVCDQEDPIWVLNPGAAGRSRTYGGPSCIILNARRDRWQLETLRFPNL